MTSNAASAACCTTARVSGESRTTKRQCWAFPPLGAQVAASRHRCSVASSTGSSVKRRIERAVESTSHTSSVDRATPVTTPGRHQAPVRCLTTCAVLHHERHSLERRDVGERVAGHADDVGEHLRGDASEVRSVDQVGGRRWSLRGSPGWVSCPAGRGPRAPRRCGRARWQGRRCRGRSSRRPRSPWTATPSPSGTPRAALAWSDFGWSEMSQFSVSAQVETRKVPVSTSRWMVSSLIIIPCSMQSMPASSAAFTAWSPWACVATRRPRRWASSAIAVELLGGVLLGTRRAGRGHHAAGRAALDELGAVGDLVADRLADLADPVGDALLDGHPHDAGREAALRARVEVSAGRADGVAGGDDPRSLDPAGVDGLGECDVDEVAAGLDEQAEVPHRREAGGEGPLTVGDRAETHLHRVHPHRVEQARAPAAEDEVDLHVHEARARG